jgi:hypothetical protein
VYEVDIAKGLEVERMFVERMFVERSRRYVIGRKRYIAASIKGYARVSLEKVILSNWFDLSVCNMEVVDFGGI